MIVMPLRGEALRAGINSRPSPPAPSGAKAPAAPPTTAPPSAEPTPTPTSKPKVTPTPKSVTWAKLTVKSVYKGSKWNDLAVSELHALAKE